MGCKTKKYLSCKDCCFIRHDKSASTTTWMAFECGNSKSQYYRCLLNITINGNRQTEITWTGCEFGKRRLSLEQKVVLG